MGSKSLGAAGLIAELVLPLHSLICWVNDLCIPVLWVPHSAAVRRLAGCSGDEGQAAAW